MSEPQGYGQNLNEQSQYASGQYGSGQYGQQGGSQQNPYGQQSPYGGGVQVSPYGMIGMQPHPQGMVILILGILSVSVMVLCGPFAWSMGNKALKEIDANPGAYSDRGQVVAGRVMGIIGTCLLALSVLFVVIYFIFFVVIFGIVAANS